MSDSVEHMEVMAKFITSTYIVRKIFISAKLIFFNNEIFLLLWDVLRKFLKVILKVFFEKHEDMLVKAILFFFPFGHLRRLQKTDEP